MEIPEKGPLRMLPFQNRSTEASPTSTAVPDGRPAKTTPADSVRLSAGGSQFAAAVKHAQGASDIREDRVMRLKRRLEEGSYRIEGGRIAAGMIDEAVENNHILEHIDEDE
jgi:flagellar biosynthesis anti-sigma factor FlgM